jgi:hypothetical protein
MINSRWSAGIDALPGRSARGSGFPKVGARERVRLATGFLTLILALFGCSSVRAGLILTDSFEEGKKFADPTGYGGRLAFIESINPRTGSNALFLNTKEGALYTLTDTFQPGTYTVSYYARRETTLVATYSILAYGITGFVPGEPTAVGGIFLTQADLPAATYRLVTYSATIAPGSPALGQPVQLLIDQSNNATVAGTFRLRIDDVSVSFTPAGAGVVPEPSSMAMLGIGALGMAYRARRKGKSQKLAVL